MSEHWIRLDEREAELLNKMKEYKVDLDELLNFLDATRKQDVSAEQTEKGVKTNGEVLESLIARVEALERKVEKKESNPPRTENQVYDEMLDNLKSATRIGELVRCLVRSLINEAGAAAKTRTGGD